MSNVMDYSTLVKNFVRNVLADRIHLSEAEILVSEQIAIGKSGDEIAMAIHISEKTVKFHATSIYKKSGTDSKAEFIYFVARELYRHMNDRTGEVLND